jgi:stage II sporulation protein D
MAVEAAKKTRGLVCTWESPDGVEIFKTYFSSTCGGCTQSAERMHREDDIPPLAGGIRCLYCQHSPFYWWGPVRLSKQEITRSLRAHYPYFEKLGVIDDLAIVEKSSCGRPVRLRLRDEQGRSKELAAEDFRLAMDIGGLVLKSSFFRPVVEQASIVFTEGRGFGHGMGLCQYGADGMARNGGATAEEIVRFYYPGARVRRAYK